MYTRKINGTILQGTVGRNYNTVGRCLGEGPLSACSRTSLKLLDTLSKDESMQDR